MVLTFTYYYDKIYNVVNKNYKIKITKVKDSEVLLWQNNYLNLYKI